jgi:hypothetical protein
METEKHMVAFFLSIVKRAVFRPFVFFYFVIVILLCVVVLFFCSVCDEAAYSVIVHSPHQ